MLNQKFGEDFLRHIQEAIRLEGGNDYAEGRLEKVKKSDAQLEELEVSSFRKAVKTARKESGKKFLNAYVHVLPVSVYPYNTLYNIIRTAHLLGTRARSY